MLRRLAGLSLFAVAILAAGAVLWWSRLPVVTIATAERGAVAEVVYATGVVEPVEWAKVVPVVRGRIVELCDCEGQPVARGDVLGRLDDSELRAQMREIEARLAFATRTQERIQELLRRQVGTAEQLDRANSEVAQVRALLAAQQERLDNMVLRAPQDGVVLRRDFHVGEIVSTNDVVAWVGRPAPLQVLAEVAEEDIAGVVAGQAVLLRHDGFRERTLRATVQRITPRGDPVLKTFRVYLSLPADTPLRIGMSVEANIVVRERADAVVVPVDAVRDGAVFTIAEGRAERHAVTTGIRGLRGVEITGGLAAGARVLAPVPADTRDGAPLRLPGEGPLAYFRRLM